MYNKRGEVSETISWLVATIIIFILLMFFLVSASFFSETKKITRFKSSLISSDFENFEINPYYSKTIFTYYEISNREKKAEFYESRLLEFENNSNSDLFSERSKEVSNRLK